MTETRAWRKVWHVGDDVDTDALAPGAYMQHGIEVIAQHCLENVLPLFAVEARPGDIVVAGRNFGIGSSREQAAGALILLGIAAVVAPSYGGLFFRNAFNLGLLLLTCPQTDLLRNQELVAPVGIAQTLHFASGLTLECEPVPDFLLRMVRAGGLLASLKEQKLKGELANGNAATETETLTTRKTP